MTRWRSRRGPCRSALHVPDGRCSGVSGVPRGHFTREVALTSGIRRRHPPVTWWLQLNPVWCDLAYKTAMDQYAMGVNLQIGNRPADVAKESADFVGRMSYLLRHGRHVADIAVLYPIAALQAAYYFSSPPRSNRPGSTPTFYWALEGGLIPPETDYMDLGEMLYRGLRLDYTYVHPEVLESRTIIDKGRLILDNKENREEFRVLMVPGGDTISAAAAKKILEFYRSGGTVIATHKLPSKSAEFNRDKEVQQMVGEVFGFPAGDPLTTEIRPVVDDFKNYFANHNQAGGKSFFLPQPDIKLVSTVLKESVPVADVDIQQAPTWPVKMGPAYDGALTYIQIGRASCRERG